MDHSGYQCLIANIALVAIGLVISAACASFFALSKRFSFRGWAGGLLFACATLFFVLLSLAIANFTWDVLLIHTLWANVAISLAAVYPFAFLLVWKVFSKDSSISAAVIRRTLLLLTILIVALLAVWYLAER